jgi:phosphoribosyl 1,2-cyclic phosphodiesterase
MALKVCSLASGSSGNATYVSGGGSAVLVDCGPSARDITARLAAIGTHPSALNGILISHAHTDHYRAAGTLAARYGLPVYVDPSTAQALRWRGRHTSWKRLRETRPVPERIGGLEIRLLDTSHGFSAEEGRTVAFHFRTGSAGAAIVTDLGIFTAELARELREADILILEANYDEETVTRKLSDPSFASDWAYLQWVRSERGHLSNRQCAEALAAILDGRPRHVFLGHLSENHSSPRRDNNDYRVAFAEAERVLARERLPLPQWHRTYRMGRDPAGVSEVVEV